MKFPLALFVSLLPAAFAAFGVTRSGSNYVVDSGAGLVTTINGNNGDITSLNYNGKQLQDGSKYTHLSSGLGTATVSSSIASGNTAVITIKTSTITQYYIVRSGTNTLYIGTYASAEPSVGELRFLARLSKSVLPNGHPSAEIQGASSTVEGSDVFVKNGQTRSKFYSSIPFIRDQVHGVTGSGVGAYIIIPGVSYETSSGGPFFRDIDNQGGDQQELYWYMNSGHYQPDLPYKTGFFGPYALAITNGSAPSADLDTSFMESLGLQGYVPASGRGTVSGTYSGVLSGQTAVIGFKNSAAQYWATGSGGSFTRDRMKPGTYTTDIQLSGAQRHWTVDVDTPFLVQRLRFSKATQERSISGRHWFTDLGTPSVIREAPQATMRTPASDPLALRLALCGPAESDDQGELEAGSGRVTVSAGQTASVSLSVNLSRPNTIWSIGTPDGTPKGFLNADKIETMHPSDSRMSKWGPITFTIGSSSENTFPMAQFKSVNNPTTIRWNANSSQIGARTLRIRTTGSFAGGRPSIQVNNWSSSTPGAPTNLNSRGVTRGTWRGINQAYDYSIPSGVLVSGSNTININVVSGSSGDSFLSPNFIYDSVELF